MGNLIRIKNSDFSNLEIGYLQPICVTVKGGDNVVTLTYKKGNEQKTISFVNNTGEDKRVTSLGDEYSYLVGGFNADENIVRLDNFILPSTLSLIYFLSNCANLTYAKITGKVANADSTFLNSSKLTTVDLSDLDFSSCVSLASFINGTSVKKLDLSNKNLSSVTSFSQIARNTSNLEVIDFSNCIFNPNGVNFYRLVWGSNCREIIFDNTSIKAIDLQSAFYDFKGETLDFSSLHYDSTDSSSTKNLKLAFAQCDNLKEIKGLENFDFSQVTDMGQAFGGIPDLYIDTSGWTFEKCTNFRSCFAGVSGSKVNTRIKRLDLSGITTRVCTDYAYFINYFYGLEEIDISNLFIPDGASYEFMFRGCPKLKRVVVTNCNVSTKEKIEHELESLGWVSWEERNGAFEKTS